MGHKTMRKVTRRRIRKLRRTKREGGNTTKRRNTTKRKIIFKLSGEHTDKDIDDHAASVRKASAQYGFSDEPYAEEDLGKKAINSAEVRQIQKTKYAQQLLKKYYEFLIKKMGEKGSRENNRD
jgi:hypothetical protein